MAIELPDTHTSLRYPKPSRGGRFAIVVFFSLSSFSHGRIALIAPSPSFLRRAIGAVRFSFSRIVSRPPK